MKLTKLCESNELDVSKEWIDEKVMQSMRQRRKYPRVMFTLEYYPHHDGFEKTVESEMHVEDFRLNDLHMIVNDVRFEYYKYKGHPNTTSVLPAEYEATIGLKAFKAIEIAVKKAILKELHDVVKKNMGIETATKAMSLARRLYKI